MGLHFHLQKQGYEIHGSMAPNAGASQHLPMTALGGVTLHIPFLVAHAWNKMLMGRDIQCLNPNPVTSKGTVKSEQEGSEQPLLMHSPFKLPLLATQPQ